jgi:cell division protein FtsB
MAVPARTKYIFLTILFVLASINFTRTALEIIDNSKRLDSLSQEVEEMETQKQELEESVSYKNTDEYVEEMARNDLNLVKPGEKVYVIPKELKEDSLEAKVLGGSSVVERLSSESSGDESNITKWIKLFTKE